MIRLYIVTLKSRDPNTGTHYYGPFKSADAAIKFGTEECGGITGPWYWEELNRISRSYDKSS